MPPHLQTVYIDYQSENSVVRPPLLNNIEGVLRRRGALLTKSAKPADTVLTLSPPEEKNQFNSVASNGRDRSYTLIEGVTYHLLIKPTGRNLQRHIEVTQDYSFNGNVAVAKQEEVKRLRESLQKELAERMYFQLRAAASSPVPETRQEDEPNTP